MIAEVVFRTGRRLLVAGTPGELSALRDAVFRGMDANLDGPTLPTPLISKVWSMAGTVGVWLLAGGWFSETNRGTRQANKKPASRRVFEVGCGSRI